MKYRLSMRQSLVGLFVLAAILLSCSVAEAALLESELKGEVESRVAVLRYLHRKLAGVEDDLKVVEFNREVTEKQLATQIRLLEEEQANENPEEIKIAVYKLYLTKLEQQLKKLNKTNLEELYAKRIVQLTAAIKLERIQLEARMNLYAAQFGRPPDVPLDFKERATRYKPRLKKIPYLKL